MTDPSTRPSPSVGGINDLVEPLFLYICRLNRVARNQLKVASSTSAPFSNLGSSFEQTRADIDRILNTMQADSAQDAVLARQFERVQRPLVYFVDSIIAGSSLPYRDRWLDYPLAAERWNELGGDAKFFLELDECLKDATEEATERLVFFYTCLGLGFAGMHAGSPLELDLLMQRINQRIRRRWLSRTLEKRICPECYEHTDKSDLPKPSRDSIVTIAILWASGLALLFIAYLFTYKSSSSELMALVQQLSASGTPLAR